MNRHSIFLAVVSLGICLGASNCEKNGGSDLDGLEISAEQCRDGEDNDGDGKTDCKDSDCAGFIFCAPDASEELPDPGLFNYTSGSSLDLGDIKASRDFYLPLTNIGQTSITDIELASSNESFSVFPSTIASLAPWTTPDSISLIRLNVQHGIALDGTGFAPLLPMGPNSTTLTVTGKTMDANGSPMDLQVEINVSVNALLLDAEIYCDGNLLEIKDNEGSHVGPTGLGGLGAIRFGECAVNPEIKNVGNVDFQMTAYGYDTDGPRLVKIGETTSIHIEVSTSPAYIDFELDGDNTIPDLDAFDLGNDGNAYFALHI